MLPVPVATHVTWHESPEATVKGIVKQNVGL